MKTKWTAETFEYLATNSEVTTNPDLDKHVIKITKKSKGFDLEGK